MTARLRPAHRNARRRGALLAAAAAATGLCAVPGARAHEEHTLETVIVVGNGGGIGAAGEAEAASAGTVGRREIEARAVYRPAELFEAVPGLVVTQHSGEGKASQFYLRGFNLDHGTDLRTSFDGMPVNQRSHAHGQGWTDLNFIIPELAGAIDFRKGPFHAADGDFATAGSVAVRPVDTLPGGIASVAAGSHGYRRALLADSPGLGAGHLLYALEATASDGPFVHPDGYRKLNGVLRYSAGSAGNGHHLTAMAYRAHWNATDQIPRRAVESGSLGRYDAVDPSDGGAAHRYSLSAGWRRSGEEGATRASAYLLDQRSELYSNFTYALRDPVNGDQFSQRDRRRSAGFSASHSRDAAAWGREAENAAGVDFQHDDIDNGLAYTRARRTLSTVRADRILQTSVGAWAQNTTRWTPWFRTVAGVRADAFRFDVRSDLSANSGTRTAAIANPKLAFILGPWSGTELYANLGGGFHSNDARGTTLAVDPTTGAPAARVPALVRARGAELGARAAPLPGLRTTFALYRLDLGSELVFAGDAGTTVAGRPSRRSGLELTAQWAATDWLFLDADLAYARARFRDGDPEGEGDRIPGAVEGVAALSASVDRLGPWYGALQWRWFGPRPLVESNAVRSAATSTLNGRVGYRIDARTRVQVEGFNLADRRASAVDYFYRSRLPGEPAGGVEGVHFHPVEPRSFRVALIVSY